MRYFEASIPGGLREYFGDDVFGDQRMISVSQGNG
jgi:hypothetical protein